MSGYFSASKKFAERRSLSRLTTSVSMLAVLTLNSTEELSGLSRSVTIVTDRDKPESSSVEFSVKTASIDTDVVNRDNDLRSANFFEAEKYPDITFKSTKVKQTGKDTYDVTGNFTMHGVTREITLPVTYLGAVKTKDRQGAEGEKVGFETAVTLNRKDYGIIWNRPLDQGGL